MAGLRVRPVEKRSSIGSSTTSTSTGTGTDTPVAGAAGVVGIGAAKSASRMAGKPASKIKLNPKVKLAAPAAAAAVTKTRSIAPKRALASSAAATAAVMKEKKDKKDKKDKKEKSKSKSSRLASATTSRDHPPTAAGAAGMAGGELKVSGGKKAYLLPWEDGFEDRYASDHVREEEQLVACVCGEALDDRDEHRRLIMCDHCCTWQHFPCMELNEEDEPLDYFCHICLPEQHEHLLAKLARGKSAASKKVKRPSSSRPPVQPAAAVPAAVATKAKSKTEDSVSAKAGASADATKTANGTRSSARKRRASESSEEEVLPVSKRARGVPSTATASRVPGASAAPVAKVSPRAQVKVQARAAEDSASKTHARQASDSSCIVVLKVSSRGSASDSAARESDPRPAKGKKRVSQEAMVSIETTWQQPTRSPIGSRVKFDDVKNPSRPASAASKSKTKLDADLDAIPITTARRIRFVEKSSTPERTSDMDAPAPFVRHRSVTPSSGDLPAGAAASPRHQVVDITTDAKIVPPKRIVTPVPTALQAQQIRRASSTVPISAGNEVDLVDTTPATTRTARIDMASTGQPSAAVGAATDRPATDDEIATSFNQAAIDSRVENTGKVGATKNAAEDETDAPQLAAGSEPTEPQQDLPKGKSGDTGKVDASSIISGKRARKPSAKALQSLSEAQPPADNEIDEDAVAAHTRSSSRRGSTASTASVKSAPTPSTLKAATKGARRSLSPTVRMKRSPSQLNASSSASPAQAQTQTPIRAATATVTSAASHSASTNGSAQFSIERERRPYQGRLDDLDNESVLDGKRQRKLTFKAAKPSSASAHRHGVGGDGGEFAIPTKPAHALDGVNGHPPKSVDVTAPTANGDHAAAAAAAAGEKDWDWATGRLGLRPSAEWVASWRHENPLSKV